MPKGYWVVQIDVTDAAGYEGYKALASRATADYGGRYIVRGGEKQEVEGAARSRIVVVEFPSYAAARACYEGAAYQEAARLRQAHAESDFLVVEGYDG